MLDIESTTLERLEVLVTADQNPTTGPPEFAVNLDANGQPTGWAAGTWSGTWSSTTGEAIAVSPRLGASGELPLTQGNSTILWIRWPRGDELIVRRVIVLSVS